MKHLMTKSALFIFTFLTSAFAFSAELTEKWAKRIESSEATYLSAIQKADNARFFAVQKAVQERMKVLKAALAEATKSGDFDAATELKSRITAAEMSGSIRQKPKNTVKWGAHEYALIQDNVTWNVARKRCEEMGGHLVTIESPEESTFVLQFSNGVNAWAGANDEEVDGQWHWIFGDSKFFPPNSINGDGDHLTTHAGNWHDFAGNTRQSYICEWEAKSPASP
jgi:hypothetical protein